jgi:hypothetical protein
VRRWAIALALFGCIPAARANENLKCFGTDSFFGSLSGLADGKKGPLNLQKYSMSLPGGSFEDRGEPGAESQRLTAIMKNQVIPQPDGGVRTGDVRMVANLDYEDGQLSSFSQSLYEVGGGGMISSSQTSYDWAGSSCRPTRIVVRDRRQLGDKRGVLFDAKLCQLMKAEGVNAGLAEACVANAKKTLNAIKKYDQTLRAATKEAEFLVSANPFVPGAVVPTVASVDNAVALNLMASCAAFDGAGAAAKKARPQGGAGSDKGASGEHDSGSAK